MTIQTWKKEFYFSARPRSKIKAIEATIQKLEGFKKKNIKKHKIEIDDLDPYFSNINTCPLCKYARKKCEKCVFELGIHIECEQQDGYHEIWDMKPQLAIKTLKSILKNLQAKKG